MILYAFAQRNANDVSKSGVVVCQQWDVTLVLGEYYAFMTVSISFGMRVLKRPEATWFALGLIMMFFAILMLLDVANLLRLSHSLSLALSDTHTHANRKCRYGKAIMCQIDDLLRDSLSLTHTHKHTHKHTHTRTKNMYTGKQKENWNLWLAANCSRAFWQLSPGKIPQKSAV